MIQRSLQNALESDSWLGVPVILNTQQRNRITQCFAQLLLEPGDIDGMTARAIEILDDPEMWKAFSQAGRAVAVERFSAKKIVPIYEDYCRSVIAAGSSR